MQPCPCAFGLEEKLNFVESIQGRAVIILEVELAPASEEGRQLCKSSPESVMVTDLLVSPKVCEFRGVLLLSEAVYFGELDDFAVRILFGDDLRA